MSLVSERKKALESSKPPGSDTPPSSSPERNPSSKVAALKAKFSKSSDSGETRPQPPLPSRSVSSRSVLDRYPLQQQQSLHSSSSTPSMTTQRLEKPPILPSRSDDKADSKTDSGVKAISEQLNALKTEVIPPPRPGLSSRHLSSRSSSSEKPSIPDRPSGSTVSDLKAKLNIPVAQRPSLPSTSAAQDGESSTKCESSGAKSVKDIRSKLFVGKDLPIGPRPTSTKKEQSEEQKPNTDKTEKESEEREKLSERPPSVSDLKSKLQGIPMGPRPTNPQPAEQEGACKADSATEKEQNLTHLNMARPMLRTNRRRPRSLKTVALSTLALSSGSPSSTQKTKHVSMPVTANTQEQLEKERERYVQEQTRTQGDQGDQPQQSDEKEDDKAKDENAENEKDEDAGKEVKEHDGKRSEEEEEDNDEVEGKKLKSKALSQVCEEDEAKGEDGAAATQASDSESEVDEDDII